MVGFTQIMLLSITIHCICPDFKCILYTAVVHLGYKTTYVSCDTVVTSIYQKLHTISNIFQILKYMREVCFMRNPLGAIMIAQETWQGSPLC